jgi:hypothetical protein
MKFGWFRHVNSVQNRISARNGVQHTSCQSEGMTMARTTTYSVLDRPEAVVDEIVASCNGGMRAQ